jgi:hypothetical protein
MKLLFLCVLAALIATMFPSSAKAEIWGIKSKSVNLISWAPSLLFHFKEDGSAITAVANITVGSEEIFADGLAITSGGQLFAFQLDTNTQSSRLVRVDKSTAAATPVGPYLANRDVRGACISKEGRLLALDITANELLHVSLESGAIVGDARPLTHAGSPYRLSNKCDFAQRADGIFFLGDATDTNIYRLDATSGILSQPVVAPSTNGGLRLVGLGFSRESVSSYAFAFDEVNRDDIFVYDTENGLEQTRLFGNIFPDFNAGTGDLASQAFASDLLVSIAPGIDLCFDTILGTNYQIEYQSVITGSEWVSFGAPIEGTGLRMCIRDSSPAQPQRYYRVRQF